MTNVIGTRSDNNKTKALGRTAEMKRSGKFQDTLSTINNKTQQYETRNNNMRTRNKKQQYETGM